MKKSAMYPLLLTLKKQKFNLRCVYAMDLNNGTVKIGVTQSLVKRISNVKNTFNIDVCNEHHSVFMPEFHAQDIERRIFKTLSNFKVASEVFAVSFETACNEIDRYADFIAECNRNYILRHFSEIQETYEAMGEALREIDPLTPATPPVDEVDESSPLDDLTRIDYHGQRVMTTAQLANAYKCPVDNIKVNFNRNKNQFVEGEHYIKLEGAELQAFRLQVTESYPQISPMTRTLYLWTHQGVVRHCKIIDTPEAWKMFGELETAYFNSKTKPAPINQPDNPTDNSTDDKISLLNKLIEVGNSDPNFKIILKSLLK